MRSLFFNFMTAYFLIIIISPLYAQTDENAENVISQQQLKKEILLPSDIAAKVNGIPITKKDLTIAVAAMDRTIKRAGQLPGAKTPPKDAVIKSCLDTLISSELLFQEAQKLKITVTDEDLNTEIAMAQGDTSDEEFNRKLKLQGTNIENFRNSVLKTLYIRNLILKKTPDLNKPIKESDLRLFYDTYKNNMQRPETLVRLSSITLKPNKDATPEEIEELMKKMNRIKEKLDEGADWNTFVKKYSSGPKENGGDIGFFIRTESDTEIPGKIGETSKPITNLDGIHILKVTDRKEKGSIMDFEEARSKIEKTLQDQKVFQFVDDYVKELRAKAHIEIYIN